MAVSNKIKAVLAICEKKQIELAEYFGMGKQSMNNKMNRDSWSAKDLIKIAEFTGCKVAFVFPNGQQIVLENEKSPDEQTPEDKM